MAGEFIDSKDQYGARAENLERAMHTEDIAGAPVVAPGDRSSKKVLLIAFDFPPRRTSGVYRPTALVRYLPLFGWQPTVLTIRDPKALEDAGLLAKVPANVEVVRTPYLRINGWEDSLHGWVQSLGGLRRAAEVTASSPRTVAPGAAPNGDHRSRLDAGVRMAAAAVRAGLYFPDESAGWIPIGVAAGLELAMRERFDAVYTTHPPRSAHVIGMALRALCGVPWVAEFRDPWVIPDHERPIFAEQVPAPRRNKWLHARILKHADGIVTVTTRHAEELRTVFHAPADKLAVVTNGFDEDDFNFQPPSLPVAMFEPELVHLAHFGTVYEKFSGRFFPALAELLGEKPQFRNSVRVHVVGFPDTDTRVYAEGELKGVIQLHGFIPHAEALSAMRASHALLLFYGHDYTSRAQLPGKLYEYLRIGQPLFAVAYPGGVRDLITRAEAGWVLHPEDVSGIKQALLQLIEAARAGAALPQPRAEVVSEYRYDRLAGKVASVLERAATK
jgi:glycosyltransferase involved in cell wall biosynthesis